MSELQHRPLDWFREYAGNPRINDHAVAQTAAAIKKFGFRVPILAKSNGEVIDGHLRLKAARLLNLETVPVIFADDMSETDVRAFRLSVNKIADLAQWDEGLLAAELVALADLEFDMGAMGFSAEEVGQLVTVPNFAPGSIEDQGRLDQKSPIICPNCKHEFTA